MKIEELKNHLTEKGFEFHGRCRGRSGACYLVASKRGDWDYGDKECRSFIAVRLDSEDAKWIRYKFSVSSSALYCEWVRRLTNDPEEFLLQAGFLRFRRILLEDDSPGRSEEFILHNHSSEDEFVMYDPVELPSEVKRVRREVLDLLWQNRYRGIKRTTKETLENFVCTIPSVLNSVLNFFEQRKFITGAYGTSGIKITSEGELELERLQVVPQKPIQIAGTLMKESVTKFEYDVFISHASEDKDMFVRPIAQALRAKGLNVWYDEFTLKIGDSLRKSIDRGLAGSRYGLVILSHNFFTKDWPQRELSGLIAIMKADECRLLPIWYNISAQDVQKYSPILSDIIAAKSSDGLDAVIEKILAVVYQDVCTPLPNIPQTLSSDTKVIFGALQGDDCPKCKKGTLRFLEWSTGPVGAFTAYYQCTTCLTVFPSDKAFDGGLV